MNPSLTARHHAGTRWRLRQAFETEVHELVMDRADLASGRLFHKALREAIDRADALSNSRGDDRSAKFVLSRILCPGAKPAEGLRLAEEVLAAREAKLASGEFEHGPGLAYLRGVVAMCALKMGRTSRAQALVALAERSFEV